MANRNNIFPNTSVSVNPKSNDYFNSTATRQILVNSAFLIQGLLQAPTQLWGNLDATSRERLMAILLDEYGGMAGNNNWLLFSAMVECGLKEFGGEWNLWWRVGDSCRNGGDGSGSKGSRC